MAQSASIAIPTAPTKTVSVSSRHRLHEVASTLASTLEQRVASQATTLALYQALLEKLDTSGLWAEAPPRALLEVFLHEARAHLELLRSSLAAARERLAETERGFDDPTDSLRVLAEGRATVTQCVHALVAALVVADEGWATLCQLTGELGQSSQTAAFASAAAEQQRQWQTLVGWLCEPSFGA